jgi:N-acetyl-gamma-glutamyl-phosphate reductase
MYAADNLSAYSVFGHRHTGEMLEQLNLTGEQLQFTPHLLPIPRGILSTIYVRLSKPGSIESIQSCFDAFYANSPLVRVRRSPVLPQIQHVVRTSFCDIGFQLAPDGKRLVVISCLDNLLKGAASQAVQNMNLMAGWPETEGLL